MSQYKLILEMPDIPPRMRDILFDDNSKPRVAIQKLRNVLNGIMGGAMKARCSIELSDITKQVTIASMTAGDAVIINGVIFTAATAADQSSNNFSVTGTDAVDATSLATIINGSTSSAVSGKLKANATSDVVEIYALNQEQLTVTSTNSTTAAVADVSIGAATATLTCSAVSAGDSCAINGVVFTAGTGQDIPNRTFGPVTGGDSTVATSLAAVINGDRDPGIRNLVRASASSAVVTLTCKVEGEIGNAIQVAAGTSILAGGTETRNSDTYMSGGNGPAGMISDSSEDYVLGYNP